MGTGASIGTIKAKKPCRRSKMDVSWTSDLDEEPEDLLSFAETGRTRFLSAIEEMEEETEGPHPSHPLKAEAAPGTALGLHHLHDDIDCSVTLDDPDASVAVGL